MSSNSRAWGITMMLWLGWCVSGVWCLRAAQTVVWSLISGSGRKTRSWRNAWVSPLSFPESCVRAIDDKR